MAKRFISSENYTIPVILAILVHVLVLGGFFIVWTSTPEVPVAKPTMIATLYEVNSKSPAKKESTEKLAGEGNKTAAPPAINEQMASQKEEQKKIEQQAKALAAEKAKKQAEAEAKAKQQADALAKKQADEKAKAVALAKKKAEEKAKADELAKKKAREKAEADALAKKQADEKAKADALAKKKAEDKAKVDAAARKAKEDKEAQALADLLGDKVERTATKGDQLGDKVTGTYDELIKQLVRDNWTELGNAPPGTRVELTIQMMPDGTITNVAVSRSSGNKAFDASAVTAAKNVGRVPEIQKLDTNTFNQLYRQRTFIFEAKGL